MENLKLAYLIKCRPVVSKPFKYSVNKCNTEAVSANPTVQSVVHTVGKCILYTAKPLKYCVNMCNSEAVSTNPTVQSVVHKWLNKG